MAYSQIRINKTKELQEVLDALKTRFKLLNESEIVKMLLSEAYFKYVKMRKDANVLIMEMPENEINDDLMQKIAETKKIDKSELLDL